MITIYHMIAACVAGGDAEDEAASLRSMADLYEYAARNHDAAGGCRPILAYRLRELALTMRNDAYLIELAAGVRERMEVERDDH